MSPLVRVLRCVATLLITRALSDVSDTHRQADKQAHDHKSSQECQAPTELIPALAGQERADAIAALRKQGARMAMGSDDEQRFAELLPSLENQELFVADVNNDGRDELVVTTHEGSGSYLVLFVFAAEGKGWRLVPDPAGSDDALAGSHEYHNPLSADQQQLVGRSELFVRHCGRVYLNFAGWLNRHWFRDTFVWQNDSLQRVCTPEWLKQQRGLFQALLDRGLQAEAHAQLEGVQESCRAQIEDEAWLWMESDLALAAHRWHAPELCLAHIDVAVRAPAYAQASRHLRHALDTNRKLCTAARAGVTQRARDYDASWTLSFVGKGADELVWDPRFAALVAALVPDTLIPGGDGADRFRDEFEMNVFGPPEEVRVRDGRYLTFAACPAHDCGGNTGFAWIDVSGKRSIFGLRSGPLLASRNVGARELPSEFWRDAAAWLPGAGEQITFIEAGGETQTIQVR